MKNIVANPHPYYDVYVSESNIALWKVVMQGPPESAYADGTFVLYLDMEGNYPLFPLKGRFLTPIYHPNINRHGRICHSIFDRKILSRSIILLDINAKFEFNRKLDFGHNELSGTQYGLLSPSRTRVQRPNVSDKIIGVVGSG